MMKALHKIISVLVVLFLLAAGGAVMYFAMRSADTWSRFSTAVAVDRFRIAFIALATCCLGLLLLLTGLPRRQKDRFLSFPGESGTVSVSLRGVAAFVSKIGDEFESVLGLQAKIIPDKNSIDVVLNARIKEGVQIHEICQALQQRVRESLKDSLGVTEVGEVMVTVREIVSHRRVAG
ncbi:MAG: alkaline shock response membrane anchor protein AmaP [Lentisphaerales bacterium]|jgi:uncharacterized alkaline shock family protein YloU|nr:MAG: alkaline shock response membrane anchor protein AmaP [Lentisphaerales bacterium]